jgi:hypothetical protein
MRPVLSCTAASAQATSKQASGRPRHRGRHCGRLVAAEWAIRRELSWPGRCGLPARAVRRAPGSRCRHQAARREDPHPRQRLQLPQPAAHGPGRGDPLGWVRRLARRDAAREQARRASGETAQVGTSPVCPHRPAARGPPDPAHGRSWRRRRRPGCRSYHEDAWNGTVVASSFRFGDPVATPARTARPPPKPRPTPITPPRPQSRLTGHCSQAWR